MLKIRSKLHGKAASYLLNAYIDIQIEQALISYIDTEKYDTSVREVRQRVEEIIESTGQERKTQELLIKGFAYKRVNGFTDYWYAKLIYKLIGEKFPQEEDYYQEMKGLVNNPIIQLIGVTLFYPTLVRNYARKNGMEILLMRDEIKDQILSVQKRNIKRNKKNASLIKDKVEKSWRIKKLMNWSKNCEDPEVFLNSAAQTQLHASNWDRIYSNLLR